MILLVAVGGALGSVLGYQLVARGVRWTPLLCASMLVGGLLGGVARMVRKLGDEGLAAVALALLGPVVTFVGVAWMVRSSPRGQWWRGVIVIAGGVATAVLGYLSTDLLGLAYIKLPKVG